jgi:multidrug efflux pump subunit AcrB
MTFVFADVDSDFDGRMYVENVRFEKEHTASEGNLTYGTIKANLELTQKGDIIYLTKIADVRYHMDPKSLKYYDGTKYVEIEGDHFTMPSADITIIADFIKGSGKN